MNWARLGCSQGPITAQERGSVGAHGRLFRRTERSVVTKKRAFGRRDLQIDRVERAD